MDEGPILITGGAGFVGRHLVKLLTHRGTRCIVLDDLSTGRTENLDVSGPLVDFVTGDVCDLDLLRRLIPGCALIIHLAAAVGMRHVTRDPLRALRTNVDGVRTVAEVSTLLRIPMAYVSSSAVYPPGMPSRNSRLSENIEVHPSGHHPASIYAESKLLGESVCDAYRRQYGLRHITVRPFNLIGPWQSSDYGMVVPNFVRRALAGQPLLVYGDGTQTRTFSDVSQAMQIFWAIVNRCAFDGRPINLATHDSPISVLDLAHRVSRLVGRKVDIRFVPLSEVYGSGYIDVAERRPCLGRLRELVGDFEAVPLDTTLRAIVAHERMSLEAPLAPV